MTRFHYYFILIIVRTLNFCFYGLLPLAISLVAFCLAGGNFRPLSIGMFLLILAVPVINIIYLRKTSEFVTGFYMSGHWKKKWRGHLTQRKNNPDLQAPDFRNMKLLSLGALAGWILFGWFIVQEVLLEDMPHNTWDGKLSGWLTACFSYLVVFIIYGIYFFWNWRGIRFTERYLPPQ